MGSAIAFNSLFAIVPLGIAFVSVVSLLNTATPVIANLIEIVESTLPPEIASFIVEILSESEGVVTGDRLIIVVASFVVALWSGSRAVYAVQKSLRLVQGEADSRGYIRSRLVGIAVTVAAMGAIIVGYVVLAIGDNAWEEIASRLGITNVGLTQLMLGAIICVWVFAMVWSVYRFGPPQRIPYAGIVAGVVTVVLVVGTSLISVLLPTFGSQAVAVFGSLGVILAWLYFIGVVVVALPIASTALVAALDEQAQR